VIRPLAAWIVAAVLAACSNGDAPTRPARPASSPIAARLARFGITRGAPASLVHGSLDIELPSAANGPMRIADRASGVSANVSLRRARPAEARESDGFVAYDRAIADVDVVHRIAPDGNGTEDYILLDNDSLRDVEYSLELGDRVASVRFVGGALELLDERGAPRLRMNAPYLVDADAAEHPAETTITGCRVDRDPRAPWGRVSIDPGSRTCSVHVSWRPESLRFPAVLDPNWVATGSLATKRGSHSTTVLTTGKVLVAGGRYVTSTAWIPLSTAELYDPATGTFAATGSMSAQRYEHRSVRLTTGKVLLLGGENGMGTQTSSTVLYDPALGTFGSPSGMLAQHYTFTATLLNTGKVFIVGGSASELYDSATNTFSLGPAVASARASHAATLLADGRVLLSGGNSTNYSTAEVYNPTTNVLVATPTMLFKHSFHSATRLSSGKVLIAGGYSSNALVEAEIYDPATNTFTATGSLNHARWGQQDLMLPSGMVLLAGGSGCITCGTLGSIDVYDPVRGVFALGSSMTTKRESFGLVPISGGKILAVAGGNNTFISDPINAVSTAETWAQVSPPAACSGGGDCTTHFCVDGVCCDRACNGSCEACTATLKGSGSNGTCGPISDGTDPNKECTQQSCTAGMQTNTFVCNGSGACKSMGTVTCAPYICAGTTCTKTCTTDAGCVGTHYCEAGACVPKRAAGGVCTAGRECTSGFCADKVCCDRACTDPCEVCTAAGKGAGSDGTCGVVPADTDPRSACPADPAYPFSCKADGMCDGASTKCRVFAKVGTKCGTTTCEAGVIKGELCNAGGTCLPTSSSCAPYATCDSDGKSCPTTCTSDANCVSTAYCASTGACTAKKKNGATCTTVNECESGNCVDGYCCGGPCRGQCEACDVTGAEGSCTPVTGAPHGKRVPCKGDPTVCGGVCNGSSASECTYEPATKSCPGTCESGVAHKRSCDGQGSCVERSTSSCGAYACDTTGRCRQTCGTNADCAAGYACAMGACAPATATCSDDRTSSIDPTNGKATPCGAYLCDTSTGLCAQSCSNEGDCARGNVCNVRLVCAPPATAADNGGGCGCATPRSDRSTGAWSALAVVAVVVARRRRRALLVSAMCALGCDSREPTPPASMEQQVVNQFARFGISATNTALTRTTEHLEIELPRLANEPTRIRDPRSGVEARVALKGAKPTAPRFAGGLAIYERALDGVADVAHRIADDGRADEDYVMLADARIRSVAYALRLGDRVAGLRLLDDTLELVDADGTPRLRMNAPWIVDHNGRRHRAMTEVHGCRYDTSPVAPWGRKPVEPGSRACEVTISWSTSDVAFPAVLDPAWTMVGTISQRESLAVAMLPSGKVLVSGGSYTTTATTSSLLYDPATATFATTGPLLTARAAHAATTLSDGTVLITGGYSSSGNFTLTSEIYNPTTGAHSATGAMAVTRMRHTSTLLASGKVLVAGGYNTATTALYDPVAKTFAAGPSLPEMRQHHAAVRLGSGKVLIVSGQTASATGLSTAHLYDPTAGTLTATGSTTVAFMVPSATVLASGKVLVVGYTTANLYDPSTGVFTATGSTAASYGSQTAALLPTGNVLIAGGSGGTGRTSAEVYDVASGRFIAAKRMISERENFSVIALNTGKLLAVGGRGNTGYWPSYAEVFEQVSRGSACIADGDCLTFHCADAVCCDTACAGLCDSCTAAGRGTGADGTCGFAATGSDPRKLCPGPVCSAGMQTTAQLCDGAGACKASASTSCGTFLCSTTACHTTCTAPDDSRCIAGHFCNSAGTCAPKQELGTACADARACKSGFCADGVCCDRACTGACEACTASKIGSGTDGTCAVVAADTNPRGRCTPDSAYPFSCKGDGLCDGKSAACRVFAKEGTKCGSATCSSGALSGQLCNATGSCQLLSTPCAPYAACDSSTTCASACTTDADCVAGAYCASGKCVAKGKSGATCTASRECETGFCTDGVCCNTACTAQCEACNESGSAGTCSPVSGNPRGARLACKGDPSVCGGSCDGSNRSSCKYEPTSKTCGSKCVNNSETVNTCDGAGTCSEGDPTACAPYECGADACNKSCTTTDDCRAGHGCKDGRCVPAEATCSEDRSASIPTIGGRTACGAYLCDTATGLCNLVCRTESDCAAGNVCGVDRTCAPPKTVAEEGCGCQVPGRTRSGGFVLSALALFLLLRRRAVGLRESDAAARL